MPNLLPGLKAKAGNSGEPFLQKYLDFLPGQELPGADMSSGPEGDLFFGRTIHVDLEWALIH